MARDAGPGRGGRARASRRPRPRALAARGGRRSPTALAALAAAFALTMAVSPDARSAVLEWLGLKSVKIERREPSAPPPRPGKLGAGLGLGTPVTLERGPPRRSPFLRLPEADGLGDPDADLPRRGPRLARLRRAARVRPLDDDRRRAARAGVPRPASGRSSRRRSARARGSSGCASAATRRSSSPARTASPTSATSEVRFEDQRLAGNTLLVERADGLLIRVEGDLDARPRGGDRAVDASDASHPAQRVRRRQPRRAQRRIARPRPRRSRAPPPTPPASAAGGTTVLQPRLSA